MTGRCAVGTVGRVGTVGAAGRAVVGRAAVGRAAVGSVGSVGTVTTGVGANVPMVEANPGLLSFAVALATEEPTLLANPEERAPTFAAASVT